VRLQGIEPNDDSEPELTLDELRAAEPALGAVLDSLPEEEPSSDIDPAKFTLDRNHEYTVWLSYAEVYNERVYDLLVPSTRSGLPRPTTFGTAGAGAPTLARKALTVKSSPPADAWDPDAAAGKYVDGIRHVRVQSAAQAKAVLRLGQLHRRVFGTLANSQSSRSHAVVTIKLLRQHRGERNVGYITYSGNMRAHALHRTRLRSKYPA
jgi:kinesin family protein 20